MNMATGTELDRMAVSSLLQPTKPKEDLVEHLAVIAAHGADQAARHGYAADVAAMLKHREPEVVSAALDALGSLGEEGAWFLESVVPHLSSQSKSVRRAAATALGLFGSVSAKFAPQLGAGLKDRAEEVRAASVVALAQVGADEEVQTIADMVNDQSPVIAAAACQALGLLGPRGEECADAVAKKLDDPQVKFAALTGLSTLPPQSVEKYAGDIAAKGLTDKDSLTRQLAATVLGRSADSTLQSATDKLLQLLKDEHAGVRCTAALTFGQLGSQGLPHAAAVAALLEDPAEDTSEMHLQIGGGAPRMAPALRRPRCAALIALGAMVASEHARDCAKALGDESYETRLCALECLASMDDAGRKLSAEIAACLEDGTYLVRVKACEVLGALQAEDSMASLPELFDDAAPSVRAAALYALSACPRVAESFSNEVMKCVADAVPAVKVAAIYTIGCMGDVGRCYASVIGSMLSDHDVGVQCASCEALGRLGAYGAAFSDELAALCSSDVAALRDAAGAALAQIDGEDAGPYSGQVHMINDLGEGEGE